MRMYPKRALAWRSSDRFFSSHLHSRSPKVQAHRTPVFKGVTAVQYFEELVYPLDK